MIAFVKRTIKALLFPLYERRLLSHLNFEETPHHVGIILDGNRRWAKSTLAASPEHGHRKGAEKIVEVLQWCEEANVNIITLWLLSTDNLNRPAEELDPLLKIIGAAIDRLVELKMWEIRPLGALDLLPPWLHEKLKNAEKVSKGVTPIVAEGLPFDPRHHIAIEVVTANTVPGTVVQEIRRGFMVGTRVLRHAEVSVAAEPPQ